MKGFYPRITYCDRKVTLFFRQNALFWQKYLPLSIKLQKFYFFCNVECSFLYIHTNPKECKISF